MKRVAVIAVLAVLVFAWGASAAPDKTISVDVYRLTQGIFEGQYEQAMDRSTSVIIDGYFGSASVSGLSASLIGFNAGYRWYPAGGTAEGGFFVEGGPGLGLLKFTATEYDIYGYPYTVTINGNVFQFSGLLGYKLVVGQGISIEPAAGFSSLWGTISGGGVSVPVSAAGATYRITAGYSF